MSIKNLKLAKAENAVMSHDWKTAARLYKEMLVGNESNIEYLKALASIYVKSGEDEKAIPYYEQIITFYPHDVDAMNSLGGIYRRLKRFEESIKVLQKAKEETQNVGMINYNLGFTYKEMGNYEDAIDAFESVISENPNDVLAYNHLGSIYFASKEYVKSIAIFKKGLQVDPNHPILNYNLARCYEATKSYPEAIRCYEYALKTRPGWTDAIRDFSELLINCQKTSKAQELVEQSIKLHPLDTELLCLLGKIYLQQNDYEKSEKTYRRAEDIKNDDVKILTGLAKALEKSSKIDQALDKVGEAVDIEPDNRDVRKQYAHTLLSAQHYDQALDNINELYNNKGDKDLQILDLYGQYFICRGNEEIAKFYYDKIKKLNHHYKDYILEAADRFAQTGDMANAEKYAKDFIKNRPQHPEGYTHLGKIYNAQGKLEEAKSEFEKSVSLKSPNIFADKELVRIQDVMDKNPEKYGKAPIVPEEPEVQQEEVVEEEAPEEPVEETEEEFDFTQMGDDVLSTEELFKDDETDFWNSFDDEDEPESTALEDTLVEEDPELDEEEEEEDQDFMPGFLPIGGNPENLADENNPLDNNELGDSMPSGYGEDDNNEEDFNPIPKKDTNPPFNQPEERPEPMAPETPYESDPLKDKLDNLENALKNQRPEDDELASRLDNLEDALKEQAKQNQQPQAAGPSPEDELNSRLNGLEDALKEQARQQRENQRLNDLENALNNQMRNQKPQEMLNDHAIEAAFNAQKLAQDLASKQQQMVEDLRKENEQFIKDTVEKTVDEKFQSVVDSGLLPEEALKELEEPAPTMIDEESYAAAEDVPIHGISTVDNDESIEELVEEVTRSDDILDKIEKILSNPQAAVEYADEIELFKKLRILSNFLPENERKSFLSCKMRVIIEYIISKMTGKPGLLITVESLIKSGVLGEEFKQRLIEGDKEPISDERVVGVLQTMKHLAEFLEDKDMSESLCLNIDNILEQIELANHKGKIF